MGAYSRERLKYKGRGAYKIIVDIEKTLLKDLVYFSRNFFMNI